MMASATPNNLGPLLPNRTQANFALQTPTQTAHQLLALLTNSQPHVQAKAKVIMKYLIKYAVQQDANLFGVGRREELALLRIIDESVAQLPQLPQPRTKSFGQLCLELITANPGSHRSGQASAWQHLLIQAPVQDLVSSWLGSVHNSLNARQLHAIINYFARIVNRDLRHAVRAKELSQKFRRLELELRFTGYMPSPNSFKMQYFLRAQKLLQQVDVYAGKVEFCQAFEQLRFALPEATQHQALKLIEQLKCLYPGKYPELNPQRGWQRVSHFRALMARLSMSLAKLKLNVIGATYGKLLEWRIRYYRYQLGRHQGQPDFEQRRLILERKIRRDQYQYNKYSYFRFEEREIAGLERKLNKIQLAIAALDRQQRRYSPQLVRLRTKLQEVKAELTTARILDSTQALPRREALNAVTHCQYPPQTINEVRIFNLGHASNLIVAPNGHEQPITILTDPLFFDLDSGSQLQTCVPLINSNGEAVIPKVDYVFLSHWHNDYANANSLKLLLRKNPELQIIVPAGSSRELLNYGINAVNLIVAGSWGMKIPLAEDLVLQITPAQHLENKHWGSYAQSGNGVNGCLITAHAAHQQVFYAGVTAPYLAEQSREIQQYLNEYPNYEQRLLLSAGPNYPRHQLQTMYSSSADAVNFHDGAAELVPAHWQTEDIRFNSQLPDKASLLNFMGELDNVQLPTDLVAELKHSTIALTHHNQVQQGGDRFNEAYYILAKQLILLEQGFNVEQLLAGAQLAPKEDFIYVSVAHLLQYVAYHYTWDSLYDLQHLAAAFLLAKVQIPLVGGRIEYDHNTVSRSNKSLISALLDQAIFELRPQLVTLKQQLQTAAASR